MFSKVQRHVIARGSYRASIRQRGRELFFFRKVTPTATMHWDGRQTAYIVAGNKVADLEITPNSKTESRLFLSGILVDATPDARAVVTFGDSITDGDGSTVDANNRWPDLLAREYFKPITAPQWPSSMKAFLAARACLPIEWGSKRPGRFERGCPHHHTPHGYLDDGNQ